MKLVCPKNPKHKKFSVTAHVTEEWIVDEHSDFLSAGETGEVTHRPAADDYFTCHECGAEAGVVL